jgi:hypothetical protein
MNFEMRIADVFKLSSGYIVFVGQIVGSNDLIKSGQKAKLLVDDSFHQCIEIHGEWKGNSIHPQGYRSISTLEAVEITSEFVKNHNCVLVSV